VHKNRHLKIIRIITGLLLLLNGMGGVYGGFSLICDPEGNGIGLPIAYLENTPFSNYQIPGMILFLFNGMGSLFVFTLMIIKLRFYGIYIIMQGAILIIWIVAQLIILNILAWQQLIMMFVGILLIAAGYILFRKEEALITV
jgi:hypothetical protein